MAKKPSMAKAEAMDKKFDKKMGIKEGSAKDNKIDKSKGLPVPKKKK